MTAQTKLNVWLLSPEDLVKYFNPQTSHERVLYEALKDVLEDKDYADAAVEKELCDLQGKYDELEDKCYVLEESLQKYSDFFEYISDAYRKVDGTWPKCEIDNDGWAVAIYDHIVGQSGTDAS